MPNIPVVESGWENLDIETIPLLNMPPLTDVVQQSLSRLMGWNSSSKAFRRVAVDESGRILITPGQALQGQVNYIETFAPATNAVVVLPSNPNRILYIVQNGFTAQIILGFDSLTSTTRGIRIAPEGLWTDELYRGDVWAVAASNQAIEIAEYVLNA